MPADALAPIAPPSRSTVPTLVVVLVLVFGLLWGIGLFVLGRASVVPATKNQQDEASIMALSAVLRIDNYIAHGQFAEARDALQQLTLPGEAVGVALLQKRKEALQEREHMLLERKQIADERERFAQERERNAKERQRIAAEIAAAEQTFRSLPAITARLDKHVHVIPIAQLQQEFALSAAPSEKLNAEPLPDGQKKLAQPLAAITWQEQTYIPSARVVHPLLSERIYVVVENIGVLRSDDNGKTWQRGVGKLENIIAQRAFFTQGSEPLLIFVGEQAWIFSDQDPYFFR
jgi:hypothetical protein